MEISIITATYNSEKTIQKTINSILNQTLRGFEYVIVDGKSNDLTLEIVLKNEQRFKESNISFKYISEKDKGIYDAWNKGVNISTGNWISFLGSDDWYVEDAIEKYLEKIRQLNTGCDLVYSNVNLIRGDKVIKFINGNWTWSNFKRFMNIAHVGAFHSRKYFEKYGLFDEGYKVAGDYELLLRAKENLQTQKLDFTSAFMLDGGVSNSNINIALKEAFKAKNKTGGVPYILCYYDDIIAKFKNYSKKGLNASKR